MKTGRPKMRDQVLAAMPGTRSQIARKADVSTSTVGKWTAILRREGEIHVSGWKRSHLGAKQPIFTAGAGEDKAPPKTLTPEQSQQRYYKRHPERRKEIHANSYRRCQMRQAGHGWMAALIITK